MRTPLVLCLATLLLVVLVTGCAAPGTPTPLRVLYAGSLLIPFDRIEKAFEASHSSIDLQAEGYGSIQVIRNWYQIINREDDHPLIVPARADQLGRPPSTPRRLCVAVR